MPTTTITFPTTTTIAPTTTITIPTTTTIVPTTSTITTTHKTTPTDTPLTSTTTTTTTTTVPPTPKKAASMTLEFASTTTEIVVQWPAYHLSKQKIYYYRVIYTYVQADGSNGTTAYSPRLHANSYRYTLTSLTSDSRYVICVEWSANDRGTAGYGIRCGLARTRLDPTSKSSSRWLLFLAAGLGILALLAVVVIALCCCRSRSRKPQRSYGGSNTLTATQTASFRPKRVSRRDSLDDIDDSTYSEISSVGGNFNDLPVIREIDQHLDYYQRIPPSFRTGNMQHSNK